jgi:hypothetical protein
VAPVTIDHFPSLLRFFPGLKKNRKKASAASSRHLTIPIRPSVARASVSFPSRELASSLNQLIAATISVEGKRRYYT